MKIALGTVQFGVNYGISNKEGKTPEAEVAPILQVASELGIKLIDTACLYGGSEEIIGRSMPEGSLFNIVTKTPQFKKPKLSEVDAQYLEDMFFASLSKLNKSSIYGVLIHRVEDILVPGGELLLKRLYELKQRGLVKKIGVSAYSGLQIDEVLSRFQIDLIQLPINVLDQRLLQSGHLKLLKRAGIEIHARSAFLQGLLLMKIGEVPNYFDSIRGVLERYQRVIRETGLGPIQAALGFVGAISEIDYVVCGVNNRQQLIEICAAAQTKIRYEDFADFAVMEEAIVNPALWQINRVVSK